MIATKVFFSEGMSGAVAVLNWKGLSRKADQLFLALRLAAAEQSIAVGTRFQFLADDLFINFDDARARVGFEVLAELAGSTQTLFFKHHAHLAELAAEVVGADLYLRCDLERGEH